MFIDNYLDVSTPAILGHELPMCERLQIIACKCRQNVLLLYLISAFTHI